MLSLSFLSSRTYSEVNKINVKISSFLLCLLFFFSHSIIIRLVDYQCDSSLGIPEGGSPSATLLKFGILEVDFRDELF